jgi:hypothetical protein
MSGPLMPELLAYASRIDDLRLEGLFGGDHDDLAALADSLNDEAQNHFLIALSLLEQASRHIKLAKIAATK